MKSRPNALVLVAACCVLLSPTSGSGQKSPAASGTSSLLQDRSVTEWVERMKNSSSAQQVVVASQLRVIVRRHAQHPFLDFDEQRQLQQLAGSMLKHKEDTVRAGMLAILAEIGDDSCVKSLSLVAGDPRYSLRKQALETLGSLGANGSEKAAEVLYRIASSRGDDLQPEAIAELGRCVNGIAYLERLRSRLGRDEVLGELVEKAIAEATGIPPRP